MFFEMNFRPRSLKCNTQVNVIIPDRWEGDCFKTLWLLHGLSDDHTTWVRNTSIERYAASYGLAVIMPEVQRSWYADTQYEMAYFSYVADELFDFCNAHFKGMSEHREDNIIAGLSMGGYGALKAALTRPERYGYCASLSGALDICRRGTPCSIDEWRALFGYDIQTPLELDGGENDIFALAKNNKEKRFTFPDIFMWCGTEDALLENNDRFHKLLCDLDVGHTYETSEGDHSWKWWDLHIQTALKQFFG